MEASGSGLAGGLAGIGNGGESGSRGCAAADSNFEGILDGCRPAPAIASIGHATVS